MPRSLLFATALFALSSCSPAPGPKLIAITIDDAPVTKPLSYSDNWERTVVTDSLTGALLRHGAPAMVFAIGSDLQVPELASLVGNWTTAGFTMANHSMSHRSFNTLSREQGVLEMSQAQAVLSRVVAPEGRSRYFRFPFLEEGRTLNDRAFWLSVLDSMALTLAPVTITTDDWRYDNEYAAAEEAEDWDRRYRIGQEYLEHVRSSIRHWDDLGGQLFKRNVSHILLLHANRVNRDYLGHILASLEADGFEFVTLAEALEDELYEEDVTWIGPSGVSILESIKQSRLASGTFSSR
ncbi:MAG: polysaccharide deacetylase family protein [Rhodothermales bacterium]|nr:polysaccharide deacetylase family protein [Rhodothermales bacterium]